nr:PREDICTED: uncharacterized protein LOC102279193 [Bos mutus]
MAHLTLQSLDIEEEDIFHLVKELKRASLQPSEGGRGFTVFRIQYCLESNSRPTTDVSAGETVTLNCTNDTGDTTYSLFWYKQHSSGEMTFLIHQDSYNKPNAAEDRYSLNFQKDKPVETQ